MPVRNSMGRRPTVQIDGSPVKIASHYQRVPLNGRKSEAKLFVEKSNGYYTIGRSRTVCGYGVTKQKERSPGPG